MRYHALICHSNPIGSISKNDLKRFIGWAKEKFELPILTEFLEAIPTAELEPITKDYVQSDEADVRRNSLSKTLYSSRLTSKFLDGLQIL